jgi:hypothetical protein
VRFDRTRLRVPDLLVAGCAVLYLVWALLPWVSLGDQFFVYGTVSGFTWSGLVTFSFVLLLLAAVWVLVPAFGEVEIGVPRGWVTVALTGLALLFTLVPYLSAVRFGFSVFALLALLTAAAATVLAGVRLLPELRRVRAARPAPPVPPPHGTPGYSVPPVPPPVHRPPSGPPGPPPAGGATAPGP